MAWCDACTNFTKGFAEELGYTCLSCMTTTSPRPKKLKKNDIRRLEIDGWKPRSEHERQR